MSCTMLGMLYVNVLLNCMHMFLTNTSASMRCYRQHATQKSLRDHSEDDININSINKAMLDLFIIIK